MTDQLPKGIERIYKVSFFHAFVFGYMACAESNGRELKDAAEDIQGYLNHDEESMPKTSIVIAYRRTQQKFISAMKEDGKVGEAELSNFEQSMADLMKRNIAAPLIQAVNDAIAKLENQ